jgi:chitinase
MTDQEPQFEQRDRGGRQISFLRVVMAMAIIAGGVMGGMYLLDRPKATATPLPNNNAWTAPYVDATITPFFAFEEPGDDVNDLVLAFVVAHVDDACTPAWGSFFDLESAAEELDLDRRLARLRQTGKDAVVSFGGALNDELATVCTNHDRLVDAYSSVVDRYEVSTIDLDLEGEGLADLAAHQRRAQALVEVQAAVRDDDGDLAIWLTLPAATGGLTAMGVAALDATLAAGVDVAGVNLMVMNFGEGRVMPSGTESAGSLATMSEAVEASLTSASSQVLGAWRRAGLDITPAESWARLGATPMIGRNDIVIDVFTQADAIALVELAETNGLGRVSYWSLNRDRECGPNNDPVVSASNHCSHEDQDPLAYAQIFSGIPGRVVDAAGGDVSWAKIELLEDDPDRSPYSIWRPDRIFSGGDKTVWHGYVYEAKWWSEGDNPEAAVVDAWDTPWRIVGPVLPEDLIEPIVVPSGVVPDWDGGVVYLEGDQTWLNGNVYEAKWWNQGFQPNRELANESESPWLELDPALFVDG